jgi:hypothetical protein
MPHCGQCITPAAFLDPIHQSAHRRRVIRRRHQSRKVVSLVQAFHAKAGIRQSNPLNPTRQNPSRRLTGFEQRELDARGAAIDGQNAWVSWFHGVNDRSRLSGVGRNGVNFRLISLVLRMKTFLRLCLYESERYSAHD